MISRTPRGITISNEELAAIRSITGGFITHMENDVKPDLPGSFRPFYDRILDAAERLDAAAKEPTPKDTL